MSKILYQGLSHLGFRRFNPRAELIGLVDCFWAIGGIDTTPFCSTEKLYPDGGCSLTFVIEPNHTSAKFECNRRLQVQQFSTCNLTISARFTPGSLFMLFGLSPAQLPEHGVDGTIALTGKTKLSFQRLLDRLPYLGLASAVAEFELWLIELSLNVAQPFRLQSALVLLGKSEQTVLSVATTLGVSRRTLERQMTLQTGFNPAYFQQCQRIKKARGKLCNPSLQLANIALACGFYDQSHFNHAFRDCVNETPANYRLRKLSQIYNTDSNAAATIFSI